ncbi:uroporphyrin-III C-methyltransferase/precorrin-2 dehydrogenase/sirohydrochlorin ferrochelatase/precorrin-2 dehydrogenase/sirohydrochlorin ferrochelatase [Breznakibacter xylanolyticus]|uniref:precorrin-2 dehydrogenase n=1 Tax=Breznakibacter xylanolyticus TaxID=990 RepID=A0A2W7NGX7_9BACT|nr:bifunctional precorrin-2 dehydrogenase/sirohydrochlorin ferrochelatase [Breznakibacter xylanolyticus]MBN2744153.1 bifunctional precorrin-2 dehydrogenase/sirohydrochlorin ferrochelatase [Marinilabiliaceae bacterium]PZX10522.1 uroporphyrin-III C-methyltransferase/precorrin-2 dehydrogenase/sirohydrochlorin ferrochelatase/precorrin-2 dehydrogenase/sirohydrochlorin ferrochelatase [Breznakibacter xylanolyticus]
MNFLPISVNVDDEQILFIGGGKVALAKIKLLMRYVSRFKVVAPHVHEQIRAMEGVEVVEKQYHPSDLNGHLIVYAATDDRLLNRRVRDDAKALRCLVNVVDCPEFCDFVSPAIFKHGHMSVAVSSNGRDLHASVRWRNAIRRMHEQGLLGEEASGEEGRE